MKAALIALLVGLLLIIDAFGLSIQSVGTRLEESVQTNGIVRVIPEITDLGSGRVIFTIFTVAVVIENVANLYALEIRFRWNTTYLNYGDHTLTIPAENYSSPQLPSPYGGVLHAPSLVVKDEVDTTAGTYWGAFETLGDSGFTGNGTVFLMTFLLKEQFNTDVWLVMDITYANMGDESEPPILQDGLVRVPGIFREIAVTNVVASRTLVGREYEIKINVTVTNKGEFEEYFTLRTYWEAQGAGIWIRVRGATLQVNETKAFTTIENAVYLGYTNYSVWAQAEPLLGELNPTDNTLADGWFIITIPGDMDADRDVDIYDIVQITRFYRESIPLTWPTPPQDINGDGDVDLDDVIIAAAHYGESW